ncbi:histone deacetylase family protein [Candidatus Sumerlaeota bacterium]|nr:histone deacetylase family protein [Candidatus Sumerlaeota bacterium]
MFRIRRVHSPALPVDRDRVEQVQGIFRANFGAVADYAAKIPDMLEHPFKYGYRAALLVSETSSRRVTGFSLLLEFPEIQSALLDFMATAPQTRGGGLGSALYEATREYLVDQGSRGMYMEVLPDDPALVKDPKILEQNRRRLQFYERYGVRPIVGTSYETPIGDSSVAAPCLLFDDLGRGKPLRRAEARTAVRLILERKYGHLVDAEYVRRVVESFADDPVRFREPRYGDEKNGAKETAAFHLMKSFAAIVGERHQMHHVRDRGYVERPARVTAIQDAISRTNLFAFVPARRFGEGAIRAVHDGDFVNYLKAVCEGLDTKQPVYPYVFPIRRANRPPREKAVRAGYFCIDTFTPLDRNAYEAARAAVDVAMTAGDEILGGRRVAYALCRPPGHHAGKRSFGGFCYFNNAAIVANRLSREGRVAVLDIDYHHGNGTQDIFFARDDVLTISIHGHPNIAYPYFSGFADEVGEGPGKGFNRNLPLPELADEKAYLEAVEKAAALIERFRPAFLVASLGLDTIKGDPTGSFVLTPATIRQVGRRLGALNLPLLVVQEGGYSLRNLRRGAPAFFLGVAQGLSGKQDFPPNRNAGHRKESP